MALATAFLWPVFNAVAVTLTSQEQTIANHLVNDPGQKRPFLQLDPILTQVARARAQDMANRHYFDHVDPDGYGPNWKVQQAGYQLPSGWTNPVSLNYIESIAAGESSADATWNDWMNSPPHKEHLLAEDAGYVQETSYGVGYAAVSGSDYTYYWVVITAPPNPSAPAIHITLPTANAHVAAAQVTVSGTTSGTIAAQSVQFRIENSAGVGNYQPAAGTTTWSGLATGLVPGPNTIRAVSLGSGGALLAQTTRTFIYAVLTPLAVNVTGEGHVTFGFLGTTQRDEGVRYTLTATPAAGSLFAGWTGSLSGPHASVSFIMEPGFTLNANFVPNPFLSRHGSYGGLLNGDDAGLIKVTINSLGQLTAGIHLNGKIYAATGRLAADGTATLTIRRPGENPLTVTLSLDVTGTSGLSGTVSDGTFTESFAAAPSYQVSAGRFAGAGRYTVSLPANPGNTDPDVPMGDGYATLRVSGAGRATLTGSLADGRSFEGAATLNVQNVVSFYIPLYARLGSVSGQVTLRATEVSDLDGAFRWAKPERPADQIAPHAYDTTVPVVGSHYDPRGPVLTVPADQPDNSQVMLGDGNLEAPIVQSGTLTADHILFNDPALPRLAVKFNPATGLFSGSFVHPVTGTTSHLHGVIFQKQNAGYGYFLGVDTSGYASVSAAAAP